MEDKFLKLTNTLYKVLEFFPESDPLKIRAKDKALTIFEHLNLLNRTKNLWATLADTFTEAKIKVQLSEDIDTLLGYLWIAKTQGWLNSANYFIISNEYEKIRKAITPPEQQFIEASQKLPNFVSNSDNINISHETSNIIADISARQKKIIEFLKKNEKAQVMDLQTILPDVTKRTIRRDIDELLEAGKILRLGDFNQVFYTIK